MKIKLFNPSKDSFFPKHNLDAWVTKATFEFLKNKVENQSDLYVKVESQDPLNAFCFYLKLQQLNSAAAYGDNVVLLSQDLKSSEWTLEDNVNVDVDPLLIENLPVIEAINIKLKENEVLNWSDEEEKFAKSVYLSQNYIAYKDQMIWVKPGTKTSRLGVVTSIKALSKAGVGIPYRLNATTKVILEGLPEEKQKIIDFSKIGGLDNIVTKLREIIQVPLQYPQLLSKFDIKPPKGLILYGPPGNGKTMIARAVSHSMGAKFISIEGPELLSKYVGVAEQQLRAKFEEATVQGNSVIFIDEIDAIATSRDHTNAEHQVSLVATLLTLMDGLRTNQNIFVLAATNRLHSLDPALRRPGRFDLEFEIPLPNQSARLDILKKYIDLTNHSILQPEVDVIYLERLSEITNGYSGADIFSLYREASMNSIRKELKFSKETGKLDILSPIEEIKLKRNDFEVSLRTITPTAMRGVDSKETKVFWDNLIGLREIKLEMEKIISLINNNSIQLSRRPGFFNILCRGGAGTGKTTLIKALGYKFNYEILVLDFLNLQTLDMSEAYAIIESIFIKAKQTAPSIIQVINFSNADSQTSLLLKLFNELNDLSPNHKILLLAESELDETTESFVGFRGFGKVIDFPKQCSIEELTSVFNHFLLEEKELNDFLYKNKNKGIGQVIAETEEQIILGT